MTREEHREIGDLLWMKHRQVTRKLKWGVLRDYRRAVLHDILGMSGDTEVNVRSLLAVLERYCSEGC